MADKPKNLEEALASIEALEKQLTTASQTIATGKIDLQAARDKVGELEGRVASLAEQNLMLQRSVGLAGAKQGLPDAVVKDIEERMSSGLNEQEAVVAAIRQHKHNERLAKQKADADAAEKAAPKKK